MSDQASAIPSQLTGWQGWATTQNTNLSAAARRLNAALEKLNSAGNSAEVLGKVEYLGNDVLGYAARNQPTDDWVGDVGRAFAQASHKGIPPQVWKNNYEDFLNSKVTTDDSSITSQVGNDPVKKADQQRQAVELAAQLGEAQDAQDAKQVRAIVARLEANEKNPDYTAAFFKELGPDRTRNTIPYLDLHETGIDVHDPENVRLLEIYDTALASATNSQSWDPEFNSRLWPGGDRSGASYDQILLIKYQQVPYSEDFLTKMGDSTLFYPHQQGTLQPDYARVVFDAIAQNHDAALDYLIGNGPDDVGGTSRATRAVDLLRMYQNDLRSDNAGIGDGFSSMVANAGTAPGARDLYVGPFGTEPRIQVLLHTLAEMPDPWMADSIRPGIAKAVSENVDLFVTPVDPKHPSYPHIGSDWTWQEKIFKAGVADNDGNVDLASVRELQNAIEEYARTHPGPKLDPSDGYSINAVRAHMYQLGLLWGLTSLPVRQGHYDEEHAREERIDAIKMGLGLIPIPVPGKDEAGKKIAEYVVDHADEWGREIGANAAKNVGGNADQESGDDYYEQLGDMRLMLAHQFIAQHPNLVAGKSDADAGEYIHQLANGTLASKDPGVAGFEGELDSATRAFADQYHLPERG